MGEQDHGVHAERVSISDWDALGNETVRYYAANLPAGAEVLGPGSAVCPGEMYTDTLGMQPHSPPRAMTGDDIAHVIDEYVVAAKLALDAGFDGVELHGANGYLIEQFLNPLVNLRTDGSAGMQAA